MEQTRATLREQVKRVADSRPEEGETTKRIENQTAKVPSLGWLGLAVGSMIVSGALAIFYPKKEIANFVGLWAPSFLLIGIYNKIVKSENKVMKEQDESPRKELSRAV